MTRPGADRGSASITLAAGAAVLLLVVILIGAAAGITGQQAAACQAPPAASTAAASIPARYLAGYRTAGARYGIPWTVLAGIGTVESDNGRSGLPGVHSGTNPFGAAGPMQFGVGGAAGDTWGGAPVHPAAEHTGGYGIDGDGDGIADVYDPGDAIPSAAWFLQAHGAATDLQAALFDWNRSAAYVSDVLSWAARYSSGGTLAIPAATGPQCQLATAGPLPAGTAGTVIAYAEAQLGKPYQWGGTGPAAFDCSGLAMMAYRAAGLTIPRTSQAQWQYGTRIPPARRPAGRPGVLRRRRRHPASTWTRRHHHRQRQNDRGLRHRLPHPDRHLRPTLLTTRRPGRRRRHPPLTAGKVLLVRALPAVRQRLPAAAPACVQLDQVMFSRHDPGGWELPVALCAGDARRPAPRAPGRGGRQDRRLPGAPGAYRGHGPDHRDNPRRNPCHLACRHGCGRDLRSAQDVPHHRADRDGRPRRRVARGQAPSGRLAWRVRRGHPMRPRRAGIRPGRRLRAAGRAPA